MPKNASPHRTKIVDDRGRRERHDGNSDDGKPITNRITKFFDDDAHEEPYAHATFTYDAHGRLVRTTHHDPRPDDEQWNLERGCDSTEGLDEDRGDE